MDLLGGTRLAHPSRHLRLQAARHRPLESSDVAKAIALLERNEADIVLVFTDVQMPGDRNGFDLATEVAERWPSITIAVATG